MWRNNIINKISNYIFVLCLKIDTSCKLYVVKLIVDTISLLNYWYKC